MELEGEAELIAANGREFIIVNAKSNDGEYVYFITGIDTNAIAYGCVYNKTKERDTKDLSYVSIVLNSAHSMITNEESKPDGYKPIIPNFNVYED